jgi:hypothetical protein
MRRYPQAKVIWLDCLTDLLARATLMFASAVLVLAIFWAPVLVPWFRALLFVSLGLAVVNVGLAYSHRCPLCLKRPTMQGLAVFHAETAKKAGLLGGSAVAWRVLRHRELTCIHCGASFEVAREM